jgi:hypothetical protein
VAALVVSGWGLSKSVSHSTMIEQLTQDQVKLQKQQYLLDQNQKTTEERRQHVGLFLITHLVSIPITEMSDKPKLNFIKMVNLGEQPVINAQARWSFQSLPAEVVQKDPNVLSMVEFCPSEQTIIGKASSSFEQLPKQFGLLTRKVGPIPSTDGILELYCENLEGKQFSVNYSFYAHRFDESTLHIHFRKEDPKKDLSVDDLFGSPFDLP